MSSLETVSSGSGDLVLGDIIFLHGLGGDKRRTWQATEDPTSFWLSWLGEELPQVAIHTVGYEAAPSEWLGTTMPLGDRASNILTLLEVNGLGRRPTVFVCHSLGGLVVKQMLQTGYILNNPNWKQIVSQTRGVVFLATPHSGSNPADYLVALSQIHLPGLLGTILRFLRLTVSIQELKAHASPLRTLNAWYRDNVNQLHIKTRILFETQNTRGIRVVDETSADPGLGYPIPIDADHFSICKPPDRTHLVYGTVKQFVTECLSQPIGQTVALDTAPSMPAGVSVIGAPGLFPGISPIPLTQVPTSGPPLTELPPSIQSHSIQFGSPLPWLVAGQSHTTLIRETQPKPRVDELFEVITDPDEVPKALFRTGQTSGLAPYDVDYVNGRENFQDIQRALEEELIGQKGRLLVYGPRSIGKTREIAQMARTASTKRWTVLVAHSNADADSRLGPVNGLPTELVDAKLLVIVDNLDARIRAAGDSSDSSTPSYAERLERLLEGLERLLPGRVRVLATAHDDPRPASERDANGDRWHSFGLFRLPMMTNEGLRQILTALAVKANVPVEADVVAKLIENSDRKPETVVINVDLARRKGTPLTPSLWEPTEGESWRLRFVRARTDHAGFNPVCRALRLLTEAGLPVRVPYVVAVARAFGETHPEATVEALVGEGLLGLRRGILTPLSAEQLEELLAQHGAPVIKLIDYADTVERAIISPDDRPQEWADDLLALCRSLWRSHSIDRAEQLVSHAIKLGAGGVMAYLIRSGIRWDRRDFRGAEADLTEALKIGGDEANAYFMRGTIRSLLGNFTDALDDLDRAAQHGREDGALYSQRGTAYFQLAQWREAEEAFSAAIERGDRSGMMFFSRGMVRWQLKDYAAAELDFSEALVHPIDLDEITNAIHGLERGTSQTPASSSAVEHAGTDLMVYALRGAARVILGKSPEAEEDLTKAIDGRVGESFRAFTDAMKSSNIPMFARATEQLRKVEGSSNFEASLLHLRGLARLNQAKLAEAEADFNMALDRGFAEGEVYFGRGWARLRMERPAQAEQDLSEAIERGKADAITHWLRGLARFGLKKFTEAEDDFDKVIELDRDNAETFFWRAQTRAGQRNPEGAEKDLTAAVDRGKTDAQTLFARGLIRFDLGRYVEAEQDLTDAQAIGADNTVLFTFRGLARLSQNKLTEADEDASAAFARDARDVQAFSLRAAVRLGQERYLEAEQDLTEVINLGRGDAWVFFHRGRARQLLGQPAEAEQDYNVVVELGKEAAIGAGIIVADLFANRGQTRLEQKKWSEAAQDFSAAIDTGRDDAFMHFRLGQALKELKQYLEAESEFTLAIERENNPYFRFERGWVRLRRGHVRGAEDDFSEVLTNQLGDANVLFLRGVARYAERKAAEALTDFNAALALSTNDAGLLSFRMFLNLRLGFVDKATEDYRQLEAISPSAPDTVGCYGALFLARGDFDGALSRFREAAQRDESWCFWQGLAHLIKGDLEEARKAYKQGAATAETIDILIALGEIDFYLGRHQGHADSPETRAMAAAIQTDLRQHVEDVIER